MTDYLSLACPENFDKIVTFIEHLSENSDKPTIKLVVLANIGVKLDIIFNHLQIKFSSSFLNFKIGNWTNHDPDHNLDFHIIQGDCLTLEQEATNFFIYIKTNPALTFCNVVRPYQLRMLHKSYEEWYKKERVRCFLINGDVQIDDIVNDIVNIIHSITDIYFRGDNSS